MSRRRIFAVLFALLIGQQAADAREAAAFAQRWKIGRYSFGICKIRQAVAVP